MTGPYPPPGGDQPQYPPYAGGSQPPYPPQSPPPWGQPPQSPPPWGQPPQQPEWGQQQPWEQNPQTAPYPQPPPGGYPAAPGQFPPPPPPQWGGQPPQWGTAPAGQPARSTGAKVWPKIAGGLGALVVIAVIALVKAGLGGALADDNGTAYPTASHPGGIAATSTATAAAGGPFAGTPAAKYPEGAAGITLPKAAATGGFTTKQVSAALAGVKKAMVAGRLDSQMLERRDPEPFLKLLAPAARADMRKDFSSDKFSVYASQFAPGVKKSTQAPRVKGRISYRATKVEGLPVLEVTTNFVWVYPFEVSGSRAGDGLVVVHDDLVWQVLQPSKVKTSYRGVFLDHGQFYASGIDCDQFGKGLLAPGKPELGLDPGNDDPNSMFDPDRALDIANSC